MQSAEEVVEEVFKRAKWPENSSGLHPMQAVCRLVVNTTDSLLGAKLPDEAARKALKNLYDIAYNGYWQRTFNDKKEDRAREEFSKQLLALEDNLWLVREMLRQGAFTKQHANAPWFRDVTGYLQEKNLYGAPYFMRVSEKNPKLWVYTESPEKAMLDRRVQAKLGKILKTLVPDEKEEIVQSIATYFQNAGAMPVKFARTEEEIADVYKRGPATCMSTSASVKTYASPDLAVAYVEGPRGKIPARSIVSMKDKQYTRIHGTIACLEPALKQLGFVEGILDGNRMNPFKDENGRLLVPNMDYGASGCIVNGQRVPNHYGYVRFRYDAEEKTLIIDHKGDVHGGCGYFTPPVEKAKAKAATA